MTYLNAKFCIIKVLVCSTLLLLSASCFSQISVISTIAGNHTIGYTGDGFSALSATMHNPADITFDITGNFYIVDYSNNVVRKVNNAGIISTFAGTGTVGYSGDSGPATNAQFNTPAGICSDSYGNIYISDFDNNVVRKVNNSGTISTFAGGGTGTTLSGFATSVALSHPRGLATDRYGNIYIAVQGYNKICKVNTSGIISTIAGTGGGTYGGDGAQATAAQLNYPNGIAIDSTGNIYIGDSYNNRVRKINTSGIISTVAGNGTGTFAGDGTAATNASLWLPYSVAVNNAGEIYISDWQNSVVRKVNASGIISSFAGNNVAGYSGDGGAASAAKIYLPSGILFDSVGNLIFGDYGNNVIRKVNTNHSPYFVNGTLQTINVCRNTSSYSINSFLSISDRDLSQTEIWAISSFPVHGSLGGFTYTGSSTGGTISPSGISYSPTTGYYGRDSFIVQVSDGFDVGITKIIVNVDTLPNAGAISCASSVCVAASISISDATANGIGVWSSNSFGSIAITGSTTGILTSNSVGIDTIRYTITNSCSTAVAIRIVTVNAIPNSGVISGPANVCVSASISLTDAATGGTWSVTNSIVSISGGIVTGVSLGVDTVKYTVSNTCGISVATYVISTNPLPNASTISGASTICVGSTITLTDTASAGVWHSSNTSGSVSSGLVYAMYSGIDTITYSVTNACSTAVATKIVTMYPVSAGVITGASRVCIGSFITLSDTITGGIWSRSNTTANISSGIVTGFSAGVDTFTYILINTCGTFTTTKVITVTPTPSVSVITGGIAVCVGSSITLSDSTSGGFWSATNSFASVSGGVVNGIAVGTDTVIYSVTNACGTVSATKVININTIAPGTIIGASGLCVGTTISLSDTSGTVGGVWTAINSNANITLGVVTGVIAGRDTIYYTVSNACGIVSANKIITINPLPVSGVINGVSNVCVGSTIVLTDTSAGGVWTITNSHATVSGGVVHGVSAGIDTVKYAVTNSCGTNVATHIITVNPFTAGIITGASIVCTGSPIILSDTINSGIWNTSNAHASITSGGVVFGNTAGIDTITYSVTNMCGTATTSYIVTVHLPPSAGVIMGSSFVCVTSTTSLSDLGGDVGGIWSCSNSNASVLSGVVSGLISGIDTIYYSITNVCGTAIATKVLTVNPFAAGTINGLSGLCIGDVITLTDTVSGGIWSATNSNVNIAAGLITAMYQGLDTINYTVTNSCGTFTATKILTINPLPNAGTLSGSSTVCSGLSIILLDIGGASGGVWSVTNTKATVSGGVVIGIAPGIDTIKYTYTNFCGIDVATKVITVNLFSAGTIIGDSSVCVGSTISLIDTTSASGGIWLSINSHAEVSGGIVTGIYAGIDTISYSVTNACGTISTTKTITVNALPNSGVILGATHVCMGATITLSDIATSGIWSASNANATVSLGVVSGISSGTDTISYTVTTLCGTTFSTLVVHIDTLPLTGFIIGPDSVCQGVIENYRDTLVAGTWSLSNGYAFISGTGNLTGISSGIDTVIYTVNTGFCIASIYKPVVVVPILAPDTISGALIACTGLQDTLIGTPIGGIWTLSNAHALNIGSIITGVSAGIDTVTYSFSNRCNTVTTSRIITVNTTPALSSLLSPPSICSGSLFSYIPTSTVSGTTITWSRASVTGIGNPASHGMDNPNEILVNNTVNPINVIYVDTLKAAGCVNIQLVTEIVNPIPKLSTTLTPGFVCDSILFSYPAASATVGAIITWSRDTVSGILNDAASGIGNPNEYLKDTTLNPVTVIYVDTIAANGCTNIQIVTITVNPKPTLTSDMNPPAICSGDIFMYSSTSNLPGTQFSWSRPAVYGISNVAASGIGNPTETLVDTTVSQYIVTYIDTLKAFGCIVTQQILVTVNPTPAKPVFGAIKDTLLCRNTMYQIFSTDSAPKVGVVNTWTTINADIWSTSANGQSCIINFNKSGQVIVIVTADVPGFSCTTLDSTKINVSIDSSDNVNVNYFQYHFICSLNDQDYYQWGYDKKSDLSSYEITGEVSQTYFNPIPNIADNYYWVKTLHNGCMQKSYFNAPNIVKNIDNNFSGVLNIYPNPASNDVNIEITNKINSINEIILYNLVGQKVMNTTFTGSKLKLDLKNLSTGCYLVDCIQDGIKIAVSKIIIN